MPATADRITKRKDGLFQGMYTAQTPDGPKRKYIYGRKYKDVERKFAEAMGDAAKGFVYDDENQTVAHYMERWLEDSARRPRTPCLPQLQIADQAAHLPRFRQTQVFEAHGGAHPVPLCCEAPRRPQAL